MSNVSFFSATLPPFSLSQEGQLKIYTNCNFYFPNVFHENGKIRLSVSTLACKTPIKSEWAVLLKFLNTFRYSLIVIKDNNHLNAFSDLLKHKLLSATHIQQCLNKNRKIETDTPICFFEIFSPFCVADAYILYLVCSVIV